LLEMFRKPCTYPNKKVYKSKISIQCKYIFTTVFITLEILSRKKKIVNNNQQQTNTICEQ